MKQIIALTTMVAAASLCGRAQTAQTVPDKPVIRQGENTLSLTETPQKIMFVKTDAEDPKAAVANVLITQVGMNLLTMGMGTQMMRWNPYMGEAFTKFANLGKGMLTGHGNNVKGFEYETLPGLTSKTTVKPDRVDLLIPLEPYRPSADFKPESVEPVLIHLETRDQDQVRLLASRQVVIEEQKNGRFDMHPKRERQETKLQEQDVPIDVERQPGNILHVTTREPLPAGEYALVLRARSEAGGPARNIALKPVAPLPAPAAQPVTPQRSHGMFGLTHAAAPSPMPMPQQAAPPQEQMTGFLAWDFRVIQ